MRFRRVLLVSPSYGGAYGAVLPAGLGYIAESLERNGIAYEVLDLQLGYGVKDLQRLILQFRPDLIGFTVITYRYLRIYEMARLIKSWMPNTQIVLGGPFMSTLREQVLRDCSQIDFGVVLEGDQTIIELCEGKDLSDIKGLIYRSNGDVVYTGERAFLKDLDAIPFPRYHKFELGKYPTGVISIVSSRGCPYRCIYCPVKLSIGRHLRIRTGNSVVDELEYWSGRGYRRFGFADDNFTFYAERVNQICDELERRGLSNLELILGNGIRADKVDRALLERMKGVGFSHIAFGVESANDRILKSMHKSENLEQIEQAIEWACQLGIGIKLHFVIGTPGETMSDVRESLSFAQKHPVEDASFNNLIPYPGTELFDTVSAKGYLLYSPEHYLNGFSPSSETPVFWTPEFPLEERKQALALAKATRKAILKRSYASRLARLGPFAHVAASVAVSDPVRENVLLQARVRRLAKRLVECCSQA